MAAAVQILTLLVPVMLLSLLAGLGLTIAVLANEGRGKTSGAAQLVGLINLVMVIPLTFLSWVAQTRDVTFMFMFAAGAFALVGLLGLRVPTRFQD